MSTPGSGEGSNSAVSRRVFLAAGAALPALSWFPAAAQTPSPFTVIEARIGGRVGVAARDLATDKRLSHRADERFAMCSTFKWVLAAAVLEKVDRGTLELDRQIRFGPADLLDHAPVVKAHAADSMLTVETLCGAIVEVSDNTAANLLLQQIGGPEGLTAFVRRLDDSVTRLDRNEPALNTNLPGDPRDSTSPNAMIGLLQRILIGDALADGARDKLAGWMKNCTTGLAMLRAGLPKNWHVGDKTGRGANYAVNDMAIAWPPNRRPILIAAYLSGSNADDDTLNAAHADIARAVAAAFA